MSKNLFIFLIGVFAWTNSFGQVGYNYKQFGVAVGADLGYERAFTSIPKEYSHLATDINFSYNYTPYIPISVELQFGTLSGGGLKPNEDSLGRVYVNHYEAMLIHADFQMGEVIDYQDSKFLDIIKGFYIGSGGGLIFSSAAVQRTSIYHPGYVFPGKDNSINVIVPLRTGYEYKFYNKYEEPFFALNVGFVLNEVFGYGLNGYGDPDSKYLNSRMNGYMQVMVGFKFFFGNTVGYRKALKYQKKTIKE